VRFKNLSQSALAEFWERWKEVIRELLDEFNEDVFDRRGRIRESGYWEYPYLLLETKTGVLYVIPMPGQRLTLRIYRRRLEKVDPGLLAASREPEKENYAGGIQFDVDMFGERHSRVLKCFRIGMSCILKQLYAQVWSSLLY